MAFLKYNFLDDDFVENNAKQEETPVLLNLPLFENSIDISGWANGVTEDGNIILKPEDFPRGFFGKDKSNSDNIFKIYKPIEDIEESEDIDDEEESEEDTSWINQDQTDKFFKNFPETAIKSEEEQKRDILRSWGVSDDEIDKILSETSEENYEEDPEDDLWGYNPEYDQESELDESELDESYPEPVTEPSQPTEQQRQPTQQQRQPVQQQPTQSQTPPGKTYTLREAGYPNAGPYKGIAAYKCNFNVKVNIHRDELSQPDTGGLHTTPPTTLAGKQSKLGSNLAKKYNNPLNVSHYKDDIGWTGNSANLRDGQKRYGGYKTISDGVASAMKLLKRKYNRMSIRTINTTGYQGGKYSKNEDKGLTNLRLIWITQVSTRMNISPTVRLNLDDKETMFSFICALAKHESQSIISRDDLEKAWKKIS